MNIRTAILGPTGYTGLYLIELLLKHPAAEIVYLASRREQPPNITQEFPRLLGQLSKEVSVCRSIDIEAIANEVDAVFLALPHRVAMGYAPPLLDAGLRVIDLSADYRLEDVEVYEAT